MKKDDSFAPRDSKSPKLLNETELHFHEIEVLEVVCLVPLQLGNHAARVRGRLQPNSRAIRDLYLILHRCDFTKGDDQF